MLRDMSPDFGPTIFPAGNAPPTPPQNDPLDDIYGSAPSSPFLPSQSPVHASSSTATTHNETHEILSDLPSRQRALDTDAYREGLANSKGQYVQEGFDEGYSLGANLGQRVGYISGVLQGFVAAWSGRDEVREKEARTMWEDAKRDFAIQELLGKEWVDEEGIWKWEVKGKEEDVTFREVAQQHPIVKKWMAVVGDKAREWGVDLEAMEKIHATRDVEEMS